MSTKPRHAPLAISMGRLHSRRELSGLDDQISLHVLLGRRRMQQCWRSHGSKNSRLFRGPAERWHYPHRDRYAVDAYGAKLGLRLGERHDPNRTRFADGNSRRAPYRTGRFLFCQRLHVVFHSVSTWASFIAERNLCHRHDELGRRFHAALFVRLDSHGACAAHEHLEGGAWRGPSGRPFRSAACSWDKRPGALRDDSCGNEFVIEHTHTKLHRPLEWLHRFLGGIRCPGAVVSKLHAANSIRSPFPVQSDGPELLVAC